MQLYISDALMPRWVEFKKICEREGSSASEKLSEFVLSYVGLHTHGNPQTLITRHLAGLPPEDPRFHCHLYHAPYNWCSGLVGPCSAEACPRHLYPVKRGP